MKFLRLDDINASSKHFELYSKKMKGVFSFFPLYLFDKFSGWGPYPELDQVDWMRINFYLRRFSLKLNVAITASYVGFTKLPLESSLESRVISIIRSLQLDGYLEICSHGLTHCDDRRFKFLPRFFGSNRKFHREFNDSFPYSHQLANLKVSRDLLEQTFGIPILTFVPPGSAYTQLTIDAAIDAGYKYLSSRYYPHIDYSGINFISDEHTESFHDRDLFFEGISFLDKYSTMDDLCLFSSCSTGLI
jgi:hypothetical protein